MLKQWLLNDGAVDSITVEEKFVQWVEQLRTDRYVTVPLINIDWSALGQLIHTFSFDTWHIEHL